MRFWSGSLKYTDNSGPVAPVRRTGPSRISTPFARRCSTTSAIGVFVRKHRSAEPGIGTPALGSNSRPASWRFILLPTECQGVAACAEDHGLHAEDSLVEVAGAADVAHGQNEVVEPLDLNRVLLRCIFCHRRRGYFH